jgi:hypothetical protein
MMLDTAVARAVLRRTQLLDLPEDLTKEESILQRVVALQPDMPKPAPGSFPSKEELTRVADNQAQAQRRANPLWRRAAGTALETAATVGMTALVRRAMDQRNGQRDVTGAEPADDHDLIGSAQADASAESEPTVVASGDAGTA